MSLVEKVRAISKEQMEELANRICIDYKQTVKGKIQGPSTGEAVASIHIEKRGDTHYLIGASNLHLFFFEQGNGSKTIYPVRAKALRYTDGSFHTSSSPYAGRHCNKIVAAKYNG